MKTEIESNYKKFKLIKGNRPIVKGKVKNIVDSYRGGLDLFPYCPILINREDYVIDGQHRLEACKELKKPVHYCVVGNITLQQIAIMNAVGSKWKQSDYFNCYIENGNKDYLALQFFMDKYSLGLSTAMQLLSTGAANSKGGGNTEDFKMGLFKNRYQEKAEKLLKLVFDYQDVCPDDVLRSSAFIRAIIELTNNESYPHDEVVTKLKATKAMLDKQDTYKDYILQIEMKFNFKNSTRKVIYTKSSNK